MAITASELYFGYILWLVFETLLSCGEDLHGRNGNQKSIEQTFSNVVALAGFVSGTNVVGRRFLLELCLDGRLCEEI